MKFGPIHCLHGNIKDFEYIKAKEQIFFLSATLYVYTAFNVMTLVYFFDVFKIILPKEYGMNSIHNVLTRLCKRIRIYLNVVARKC